MKKAFINPPGLPNWEQTFSQVVIITKGATKTVYLSGQVAMDQDKQLIGANDLALQANHAFKNLRTALASAGAGPEDVVKLTIYVKDYRYEDADCIIEAFQVVFAQKNLPASTWLGVQSLALEGLLIEIDAVAMMDA